MNVTASQWIGIKIKIKLCSNVKSHSLIVLSLGRENKNKVPITCVNKELIWSLNSRDK